MLVLVHRDVSTLLSNFSLKNTLIASETRKHKQTHGFIKHSHSTAYPLYMYMYVCVKVYCFCVFMSCSCAVQ